MDFTLLCATARGLYGFGSAQGTGLEDRAVAALDDGPSGTWAVAARRELWRRDGGDWRHQATAVRDLRCVASTAAGVFAGTAEAHLLRVVDGKVHEVEGFERAEGRGDWYTPWGGPPDVRSFASTDDGALFVNVHVGGILRSDDEGESWRQTIDIHADVHEVIEAGEALLAATAWGLATSRDGGESWHMEDSGLHARYSRAVAAGDAHVFMSASDGPRGGRAALYRRGLAGGDFVRCSGGLPEWFEDNIDTGCVLARGATVAFGTEDGRVFVSEDSGESWDELASGLPPVRWMEAV